MSIESGFQSLHSRAPTRIDLAGGTVDLWPLYLFLPQPVTLNLGIDLFAEAWIDLDPVGDEVTLRSDDQGIELKLPWRDLENAKPHPAVELHLKLLRYFSRQTERRGGLRLRTKARSPAGAGLGGSSTLSIAMIGALATWARGKPVDFRSEGEFLIQVARDVETTVIQVPAGVQDYYGAMFGGLQSLRWGAASHQRESLPRETLMELGEHLLLFYSGQSRNSGINNWALFKGFIDREPGVREKFERIVAATLKLETALRAQNWEGAGAAIADEWETRRTLAPGISTPEMDRAFARAREIAPVSGKVCGAGGGGCFFVYVPSRDLAERGEQKQRIISAFNEQGIGELAFKPVTHGLEVQMQVARG